MLRVALTGGIASGKSTIANLFRELGVPVIDTDQIARDVVLPGSTGLRALTETFGPEILDADGTLQRDRLRQLIFSDARAREQVNMILHPLILEETERLVAATNAPYVLVEIPLLAETRMGGAFDRILVVDVPETVQLERLMRRDKANPAQARIALEAQASRDKRLQIATEVIENTASIETLRSKVETLHQRYLNDAKRFATPANPPSE